MLHYANSRSDIGMETPCTNPVLTRLTRHGLLALKYLVIEVERFAIYMLTVLAQQK